MLQIERVTLSLAEGEDRLREKAAAILGLPAREIQALTILRRAVDAREEVRLVYTLRVKVKNEERVLRRCGSRHIFLKNILYAAPVNTVSKCEAHKTHYFI